MKTRNYLFSAPLRGLGCWLAVLLLVGAAPLSASKLGAAAKKGDLAEVKRLIDSGADLEGIGFGGYKPLHFAIREGHLDVARLLIDRGADVDTAGYGSATPLHMAAINHRPEAVRLLAGAGANPNTLATIEQFSYYGPTIQATPLTWAVHGRWDWRFVIGYKSENFQLKPPLERRLDTVKALLVAGADVNAGDCGSRGLALYLAAEQGEMPLVQLLLQHGADVTVRNDLRLRPAQAARQGASAVSIGALVRGKGVDRGVGQHEEVADLLESLGDEEAPTTPLHEAAREGDLEATRRLIGEGAFIDARDARGMTPLYLAAVDGHGQVVEELLTHQPDLDAPTTVRCWTALHASLANEQLAIARMLVEAGADLTSTMEMGWTPLHLAAQYGDAKTIGALLAHGADPNVVSETWRHETPLMLTVLFGEPAMADLLLEHGARIDDRSRKLIQKAKHRKRFGHLLAAEQARRSRPS